jgi:two-component system sensor histidine kinase/response regulator
VEDVVQLLAATPHAKSLELACRIDDVPAAAVRGDPYRLRQILTNLIGNALKFTEAARWWSSSTRVDDRSMRFSVQDSGIGMAAEDEQRLFRPLSRPMAPPRGASAAPGWGWRSRAAWSS